MKRISCRQGQNMVEYILMFAAVMVVIIGITRIGQDKSAKGPIQTHVSDTIEVSANLIDQGNNDIKLKY